VSRMPGLVTEPPASSGSTALVVDLFSGAGGWMEGLAGLGWAAVGVEWDRDSCATSRAAGHTVITADVTTVDPGDWRTVWGPVGGLVASPPCQGISRAGLRTGIADVPRLVAAVARGGGHRYADERSELMLVPLRWVADLWPEWVALEQVPDALPVWNAYARRLRADGYHAWAGILCAADYGVPQTRRRAFMLASRVRVVEPPVPSHYDPRRGPALWGTPWVSMAAALGLGGTLHTNRGQRPDGTRQTAPADEPAPAVGTKDGHRWQLRLNTRAHAAAVDEPASTVSVGPRLDRVTWEPAVDRMPRWAYARPGTTVQADPRIGRPGHKDREHGEPMFSADAVRVELWQLGVLQGFPQGYPWQGTRTSIATQIGNAVPPPLAAVACRAASGDQKCA